MKKNLFSAISMVFVALLIMSCNSYQSKVKPIGGTSNLSYFSAQDPATGKDLWGLKDPVKVLKDAVYTNIMPKSGLFIGIKKDGADLFDQAGKNVVSGQFSEITYAQSQQDTTVTYFDLKSAAGKIIYLNTAKKSFGPYDDVIVTPNQIFCFVKSAWGVVNVDGTPILPPEFKEIVVVKETKTSTTYYLAQNAKGDWNLYKPDGKLLKKVAISQLGKYNKGAVKSELSGISFASIAKI